jgi:hypothetical protein
MTPNARWSAGAGARASSPTVDIPSDRMRVASFGPTPHSSCTSRGQNTSRKRSSSSTVRPRGFCTPAAIFATSLLGPMPIDAPSANRASMLGLDRARELERTIERRSRDRDRGTPRRR